MGDCDLSIVLVTWHPGEELLHCLRSLAQSRTQCPLKLELILIDNGSDVFPVQQVHDFWPAAFVRQNQKNLGFAGAANMGAAAASGKVLLFLNPDTESVGDPFSPLLRGFSQFPNAVALAPHLIPAQAGQEADESFQLRRLPSWGQALRELLLYDKLFPNNRFFRRDRYLQQDRNSPFSVEQPAAAALAVKREVFWGVGGFDERFFPAWFEDVDLCARLLQQGEILFCPESRFIHRGGVAKEKLGYDQFLPVYYRNAIRFWQKHRGSLSSLCYRGLVAFGMLLRLLALPFRAAVPHNRTQALRAYFRTLRVALSPL